MIYKVWSADLNSLYDEVPRPPVLFAKVETEAQATTMVNRISNHDVAAWFEKEAKQ